MDHAPMTVSRREFVAFSAAVAAGWALPWGAGAAAAARGDGESARAPSDLFFLKWDEISQDVFVTLPRDGQIALGGNVAVVHGQDGAIVIDTKFAALARTLRREIENFGKPIFYVVNTHHHADHTGGNWAFTGEKGLKVVAHTRAKPRIEQQIARYAAGIDGLVATIDKLEGPGKDRVLADAAEAKKAAGRFVLESFAPRLAVDSLNLGFPGAPIELHHSGPGHTDNDLWVWLPHSNLLHTGDLLFHGLHPYIDASAGASTRGWQKALDEMTRLCNDKTVVIPGHGEPTDAAALKQQSDYFTRLRDHVAKARAGGMSREDVVKMKPSDIPGFDTLGFEQMFPNALGVVFDELEKE